MTSHRYMQLLCYHMALTHHSIDATSSKTKKKLQKEVWTELLYTISNPFLVGGGIDKKVFWLLRSFWELFDVTINWIKYWGSSRGIIYNPQFQWRLQFTIYTNLKVHFTRNSLCPIFQIVLGRLWFVQSRLSNCSFFK